MTPVGSIGLSHCEEKVSAFSKEIMVDGTSTVIQYGGTIATAPPREAVEEFKVETSGFRAENARTGGGVFQFTSWAPGSSGKADSLVRPFTKTDYF